jgi:glycosyltransferase involved in cell wall biosynthesis
VTNRKVDLTIISPAFNEEESISIFLETLASEIVKLNVVCELIVIDDGSTDRTWNLLIDSVKKSRAFQHYKLIRFSRNYGQMSALAAGMAAANGEYILSLDFDLQHPPKMIYEFWNNRNKADVIVGQQVSRREGIFKSFLSRRFYTLFEFITGASYPRDVGDFRLISKEVKDEVLLQNVPNKVFRFMIAELHFSTLIIPFEAEDRIAGVSKYSLTKMLKLAARSISTTSTRPLFMGVIFLGVFVFLFAAYMFYAIAMFILEKAIPGWTSLAAVILGGFICSFVILSIQSVYISMIFKIVSKKPDFRINKIYEKK